MADRPGAEKPPRLKSYSGGAGQPTQRPTWKVTRRERTETSPLRRRSLSGASSSSSTGGPTYHSRTITTTERVQILQMPLDLSKDEAARIRELAITPTGEASRQVHSTTTTIDAGGRPIIGAVTSAGVPLFNGIYMNAKQRQTTTVITTTTTTYRILDDSSADEYEMLMSGDPMATALTVDVPLRVSASGQDPHHPQQPSNVSYVMVGSQTESSMSPITTDDDAGQRSDGGAISPELITLREVGHLRDLPPTPRTFAQRAREPATQHGPQQEDSFEIMEQPTSSSGSADEADYVQVYTEDSRYNIYPAEAGQLQLQPEHFYPVEAEGASTSRAQELAGEPLEQHSNVYHHGFYEQVPSTSQQIPESQLTIDLPLGVHYQEPVSETHRREELVDQPLQEHISVWHKPSKLEDEPQEEQIYRETVEQRVDSRGYPTWRDHTEPTASTSKSSELAAHPILACQLRHRHAELEEKALESEVRKYHSGFSDQKPSTSGEKEWVVLGDYPEDIYEGPVDSTHRTRDIPDHSLETYVSAYHHGFSDTDYHHPKEKTDVFHRLTGLFKSKSNASDYPSTQPHQGPLESTSRLKEADAHPMTEKYHAGYYNQLPSTSTHQEPLLEGYPRDLQPYGGHLHEVSRLREATPISLDEHVIVYHPGQRSEFDEHIPAKREVKQELAKHSRLSTNYTKLHWTCSRNKSSTRSFTELIE
ncbi:hypothetical protein M3Y97_00662500 [Aphelenchoides bicaudatus]|nr:hypothetical protein M3Y97_00662500 [Aphelenchoides bicaudatus]